MKTSIDEYVHDSFLYIEWPQKALLAHLKCISLLHLLKLFQTRDH